MKSFIALDLETADSANSAPCEIGIAFVDDGAIKWSESFLINPETSFNPIAIKIHKITPEIVKDAPTFKDLWPKISEFFSNPVVMHNASFDMNVLRKVAERYNIILPNFKYYCTYKTAMQKYEMDGYKLKNVCSHFNIENEKPHSAKHDAMVCATIALKMIQDGHELLSVEPTQCFQQNNYVLNEFELKCLHNIKEILSKYEIRYSKLKNLCIHVNLWSFMSIAKMKKGYYIPTSRDISIYANVLKCDSVKVYNRIFIDNPDDLIKIADFIIDKCQASEKQWNDYVLTVSEKTVKKRIREYMSLSCVVAE